MTQLCRKIVQVNLRWSLAEKVTVFRRFFKFIWHRILACSTRPPVSPSYTRLTSRRNSSPSSMAAAALEYPGCDPSTTSCSGSDSNLVCLKISLLGDCRIGKTSFAGIEDRWIKSQSPVKMLWPFCSCLILLVGVH